MVAEATNPSLTDSPDDFLAFLLRTGCKHQAVKRAPVRALGGRAKNGNTSIIRQNSEPSPAFNRTRDPAAALDLACLFSQTHIPLSPSQGPQAALTPHRRRRSWGSVCSVPRRRWRGRDGGTGAAQGTGRGQGLGLWSVPVGPTPGLYCPQDPSSWAPPGSQHPWESPGPWMSLTLEEAFSCTRTSASFTSNKTSCRGDEGEEALISTALSSVFNQTLARDYPNAEVMKHSQPQLFQVSSVLPFFPHHPVLPHSNLFTNNPAKAQKTAT